MFSKSFITTADGFREACGQALGMDPATCVLVDLEDGAVIAWAPSSEVDELRTLARSTRRALLAEGEVVYVETETGVGNGFAKVVGRTTEVVPGEGTRTTVEFFADDGSSSRCSFSSERCLPVDVVGSLPA